MLKRFRNKNSGNHSIALGSNHRVTLNSSGLVPVIIQDAHSREVLRLGYMDFLALQLSQKNGIVFLYRRSKSNLEKMGEKEEVEYRIQSMAMDRAKRALLIEVIPSDGEKAKSNFIYKIIKKTHAAKND